MCLAAVIAAVLYVAALLISSNYVSRRFEWFLLMYLFVSLTYTFFLKDIVLVDIFSSPSVFYCECWLEGGVQDDSHELAVSDGLHDLPSARCGKKVR